MNIKAFKRLIKEAVAEAIYEQLPDILEEHAAKQGKQALQEQQTFNFTSQDAAGLPADVRMGLAQKMGSAFGHSYPSQTPQTNFNAPTPVSGPLAGNPLAAFIADAAANMTPQERSALSRLEE